MSKPARSASGRRRSRRPAERSATRPAARTTRPRRERSFLDVLLISASIVLVVLVALTLWILLRGLY